RRRRGTRHSGHHCRCGRGGPSARDGSGQDDAARPWRPRAVEDAPGPGFAPFHRADAQGSTGGYPRHRRSGGRQRGTPGRGGSGAGRSRGARTAEGVSAPADDSGPSGNTVTRVLPGGTIGILGGGQLARMLAIEGRRMGYRIAILDQQPQGPAAQLADVHIAGACDGVAAAERLAHDSYVLTLDTEHVPAEILERLEAVKPVRPAARILRIVQDRLEQRRFLDALGAPQVRYAPVTAEAESLRAAALLEFPAVLKTRRSGYDGKGQVRVADPRDLADALQNLGRVPSILETLVDFDKEISVLLARDLDGNVRFYSIAENVHRRHVLRMSRVPARISPQMSAEAEGLGAHIASALGHVGMLAIELFVTQQGGLLVNEIAPRTHNSGHYSFGACATSQFEQH